MTYAILTGNVNLVEGPIYKCGFQIWESGSEKISECSDSHTLYATGKYNIEIRAYGLVPDRTYNYRMFARSTQGVTYGATKTFTTQKLTQSIIKSSVIKNCTRSALNSN